MRDFSRYKENREAVSSLKKSLSNDPWASENHSRVIRPARPKHSLAFRSQQFSNYKLQYCDKVWEILTFIVLFTKSSSTFIYFFLQNLISNYTSLTETIIVVWLELVIPPKLIGNIIV